MTKEAGETFRKVATGFKNTDLQFAALYGESDQVERLLKEGASPDHRIDGWTPLHHAAYGGHRKVAKLLLDAGADLLAVTPRGETAWQIAQNLGNAEVANYLKIVALKNGDPRPTVH